MIEISSSKLSTHKALKEMNSVFVRQIKYGNLTIMVD